MLLDLYFHFAAQRNGGGKATPRKGETRPAWVIPQQFVKPRPRKVEEIEALLLLRLA